MTPSVWQTRYYVGAGFAAILVLTGGIGLWAATTDITGAVLAQGHFEVQQNRQIVQHETGGRVASIMVQEGDPVQAGDLLIQLDPARTASQLALLDGRLADMALRLARFKAAREAKTEIAFDVELRKRAKRDPALRRAMQGQAALFAAEQETLARQQDEYNKRRDQITAQIAGFKAQSAAVTGQISLIQQQLTAQSTLQERGLSPMAALLALQREQARLQGQLGALSSSQAEAKDRIIGIEIEALQLLTRRREDAIAQIADLSAQEQILGEQRRAVAYEQVGLAIRAPVSGVVYGLNIQSPGAVIRPAEPLLYLVPQDRPLVIAARISPRDVDEIGIGGRVTLRLSALGQRDTPQLVGRITRISADAITDPATGQVYYGIAIALPPDQRAHLDASITLLPGMPVEVFIGTVPRSALAYLIKPFADYFARALRES